MRTSRSHHTPPTREHDTSTQADRTSSNVHHPTFPAEQVSHKGWPTACMVDNVGVGVSAVRGTAWGPPLVLACSGLIMRLREPAPPEVTIADGRWRTPGRRSVRYETTEALALAHGRWCLHALYSPLLGILQILLHTPLESSGRCNKEERSTNRRPEAG